MFANALLIAPSRRASVDADQCGENVAARQLHKATKKEWGQIHSDPPHSKFRLARIRRTIEALPAALILGKSGDQCRR